MWICINMQKSGYFIYLFWRYGWLKNPAVWLAEDILAHISGHFPQIWDLCRNIANNIHVHYRTNSVKIRQKFSISSKGPVFGLFSILVVEIFFSRKSGFVTHNFIWVSSIMPKFRKNKWYNSKKMPWQTERWMEGRWGSKN